MEKYTLDELTDKYIGEKGSLEREQFEFELKLDVLGEMIKKARKEFNTGTNGKIGRSSKSSNF